MAYVCPLCSIDPFSHSLTKIEETDEMIYYYTCPSQAKLYYDLDGIINHYNGVLSEMPRNKQWVWIFDSTGFDFKHIMYPRIAIELAKLISNKFSSNLQKIIIINPTFYINLSYKIVTPFLKKSVLSVIEMDDNTKTWKELIKNKK